MRPLLVALLGEGVVEGDAAHRTGQLARPDELVPFPARRARGVPLAHVAGGGTHVSPRAPVVSPEAVSLQAFVLLRLLLFVRERLPEVVDDQLRLGAALH